jgi:WASH complex subunit strumpellin
MDHIIIGPVRERMVVVYYRNSGGENISNINYVRRLTTDSEFRPATKTTAIVRPDSYPDDLFERFPIDGTHLSYSAELIQMIIIAVKDDDIYRQSAAYPSPQMRSFALANQAALLFVLLFFVPQVLVKAKSPMREIVDKHFYNNWVLPYYLGYIVDLTFWWNPYRAAKMALGNILDMESIEELIKEFVNRQYESYQRCQ